MRILGFCLTVWLGLMGYQAEAATVDEKNLVVEELHPGLHAALKGGNDQATKGEHVVICWMHATCSPAVMATIEDARPVGLSLAALPGRSTDYDSLASPPTSPPPRA